MAPKPELTRVWRWVTLRALVSVLRSSLFVAFVSLLVLMGYASDVLDYNCAAERQEQAAQHHGHHGKSRPAKDDDCHCLCHQFFTGHAAEPIRVGRVPFTAAAYVTHADEFPPDADPVGIEYPPQLA